MATIVLKDRVPAATHGLTRLFGDLLALLHAYAQLRRERTQLLSLGERELHDIGLSRIDAIGAAERSLWREAVARIRGMS
jgi:uncharacterized protein YjiS (DUF1127 family)